MGTPILRDSCFCRRTCLRIPLDVLLIFPLLVFVTIVSTPVVFRFQSSSYSGRYAPTTYPLSINQGRRIRTAARDSLCVPGHPTEVVTLASFCYSSFTTLTPFPFPADTFTGRLPSNRVGLIPCSVITIFALSRSEFSTISSFCCSPASIRRGVYAVSSFGGDCIFSCDQLLEKLRNQFRTFTTGFFWSLNWAVMAQNEILSPHSQMTYPDPMV